MATITAADVNKLRQTTGAGMMDCKALVEAEGDFDIQNLRKRTKVAANRSDRESTKELLFLYQC
jgi:elongation factor Ts